MGHYAQVVLALTISSTLSLIAWGWARRSQTSHIWIETGRDADQNWLQAEKEILHTSGSQPTAAPSGKRRSPVSKQRRENKSQLSVDDSSAFSVP